jgi:zinc transport system substrate-binding protein
MRFWFIASLILASCFQAHPVAAEKLEIWVSIQPQKFICDRLGGDKVETRVLVAPGHSPATFEPTPLQMAQLQNADFFVRSGVPFEFSLMRKLSSTMPDLKIIDCCRGLDLMTMDGRPAATEATGHDEGHAGRHHHGENEADPHFWIDPILFTAHAHIITKALCEAAPESCTFFKANFATLKTDLEEVDIRIASVLKPFEGRTILVYHPAYSYFARRYGLTTAVVEVEGKEPEARALVALIERARRENLTTVFVQPQFSSRRAETLASSINGRVVALDPLALDYIDNLEALAQLIAESFSK